MAPGCQHIRLVRNNADSGYGPGRDNSNDNDTKFVISDPDSARHVSSDAGHSYNAKVFVFDPASTALNKIINWETSHQISGNANRMHIGTGAGQLESTSAVDAIQFYFSSGNVSSGTFKLYGVK